MILRKQNKNQFSHLRNVQEQHPKPSPHPNDECEDDV